MLIPPSFFAPEPEAEGDQAAPDEGHFARQGSTAPRTFSEREDDKANPPSAQLTTVSALNDPQLKLLDGSSMFERPSFQLPAVGETRASLAERIGAIELDEPTPKQPFSWDIKRLKSSTTPLSRQQTLRNYGETEAERARYEAFVVSREDESKRTPAEPSRWSWQQTHYKPPSPEKLAGLILRRVEFFPWGDLPGLARFKLAMAVVGGSTVRLFQLVTSEASADLTLQFHSYCAIRLAGREEEDLRACCWALDTSTSPPTPLIVAAGTGRLVHVIQVYPGRAADPSKPILHLERSVSGPGQTVWDLATLPTRTNLVVVAGEDQAPAMYNVTAKHGSNAEQQAIKTTQVIEMNAKRQNQGMQPQQLKSIIRGRVKGELVGKFTGREAGHDKGVLSCAVHPTMPFLVTGGLDGRVCVWKLPDVAKISRSNPAVEFDEPVFRSSYVHSGQWVDQVAWASPTSTAIISKSTHSHVDSIKSRSKMMLLWTPQVLDVEDEDDEFGSKELDLVTDANDILPPQGQLAYTIERRAEWEDQNVVGDRFGTYHAFRGENNFDEHFVAVPIGPRPKLAGGSTSLSISIHHPFSDRRFLIDDGSEAERAKALFPDDRERPTNDFVPRWRPEDWITLDERNRRAADGSAPRFRAVGVSPDGTWMVAVGDQGAMGAWKRVAKVENEGEAMAGVEGV